MWQRILFIIYGDGDGDGYDDGEHDKGREVRGGMAAGAEREWRPEPRHANALGAQIGGGRRWNGAYKEDL